ncbi:diacylglycerol/lipid kinase family protein [Roseicella frigidaeris]|uniref:Diacylglycerol kinase family lipid kinase n=1 Tax=Roseicella frigidaeris TaxID=2230885 RepID=A0A327MD10_9PROT|nr:diacylglycerol kinase family protein [Roseicella frigidaeris]RAI60880.1 diacylglycerol kinase family lipid kinase [Roseicella frigidaeris]
MLILFNPAAGTRRRRRLVRALAALARAGLPAEVAETRHPGHATVLARAAAAAGTPLVVAAGGDGTIAEVAAGLAGGASRLGILPFGTANVLAWELGLPLRPDAAAVILAEGRPRLLRPGLARFADGRERLFVQMLGAGFDAAVVQGLDLGLKRRLGRGAYVLQALRELPRYRHPRFLAELDGEPVEVAGAIVSKGRLYAGRHLLAPMARPGAAGFQVALFRRGGALRAALYGAALPLDLLPRLPGVELRPARRILLRGEAVPAQADGDPAGTLPVTIEDAPGPIAVMLPATDRAGLAIPPP